MSKIKQAWQSTIAVLLGLSVVFTPHIVLISSILSTIDFYLVSNSILAGIAGFFVGGLAASVVMFAVVLILAWVGYFSDK